VNPVALLLATLGTVGAVVLATSPEPVDPPAAPVATVWEAYTYGEIPAGAETASETSVEPSTSVEKQAEGRCTDWSAYAASIGFQTAEIDILERILWLESRCQPGIVGDAEHGGSYGLAQIHAPTWCKPSKYWPEGYLQTHGVVLTCDDLFDVRLNLQAAYAIFVYAGRSFHPWSTYKLIGGTK
jgi:hypothetical protein